MRFMMLYKPGFESDAPPCPEHIAEMDALIERSARAGTLVATDGLLSSAHGARVRLEDGRETVTDGPFAETRELVAGYAIMNARSKAHAIELAREFLAVVKTGEVEVRPMHGAAGLEPGASAQAERAIA